MLLNVSTVEEAVSELAEPSLVTVTSASTSLAPTEDVMESELTPSADASALVFTTGAGMASVELVSTSWVAVKEAEERPRREALQMALEAEATASAICGIAGDDRAAGRARRPGRLGGPLRHRRQSCHPAQ